MNKYGKGEAIGHNEEDCDATKLHYKEIRDFVPYKVALRIRNFICFTLKLEGKSPELNITADDKELLEQFHSDPEFDYESIEILKNHKMNFYENILR